MTTSLSLFNSVIPLFSGHETFVLRSTWLKKGYDIIQEYPDLFSRDDAFVLLGVGKNMAQSIRYWGRVCGMFDRIEDRWIASPQAHQLFGEGGWDPFLTSPTSWWWLHWRVTSHANVERPITWFYTFNLLRGIEFTVDQLANELKQLISLQGWKQLSKETLQRDIDCMLRSYIRPSANVADTSAEDTLLCPFGELGLIQQLPGQRIYRFMLGDPPHLADSLVAFAIHEQFKALGQRRTLTFNELAYAPCSPGRIFRLDEDALLSRLQRLESVTHDAAHYTDSAGVRQVTWSGERGEHMAHMLLAAAYGREGV
jgi:hypothetical protein